MAAPVLVFAHYFGGSARSWDPLLDALHGEFVCCTPDLAGFGGAPLNGEPGFDLYGDQIEALAGPHPWVAVGHSMGGKIALAAAARRPDRLRGLILIAPSPPTPEPMSEEARQQTLEAFGDRAAARAHIAQITDHTLSPDLFDRCVEDEVSVTEVAWRWWLERGSRADISDRTQGLDLATLVITGDNDTVMGLATPFGVAGGLAHAEVQVIAGGGHLVPLEQPGAVAELIRRFIGAVGRGD